MEMADTNSRTVPQATGDFGKFCLLIAGRVLSVIF